MWGKIKTYKQSWKVIELLSSNTVLHFLKSTETWSVYGTDDILILSRQKNRISLSLDARDRAVRKKTKQ